jgi:molecular chaperone GrpE
MTKKDATPPPPEEPDASGSPPPAGAAEGAALVERPEDAVARLEGEVAQLKDRYLRLAAEYENFRKRTTRERTESWGKAQADLIQRMVDGLDDLARFAHVDPAATDAQTLHAGAEMAERKLWKALEAAGLTRIDQTGVPFDPNQHEAVTLGPAATPEQDHTVGAILQPGYRLAETLIRPARVIVLNWTDGQG